MERYNQIILEQVQLGIIEEVPQKELQSPLYPCSYILHQGVFRDASTTMKLRVVYDASAKGMSDMPVNQYLLRGPVMLADLCGLLMRFRLAKIALVSDIEKAFLNIGLHLSQRDITRFFWLKDITKPFMEENTVVFRFARVPFGFISSPFLLAATIQHHLESIGTPAAKAIQQGIYIDNIFVGTKTEDEALQFYKEAKNIFSKASLNLREWISNSQKFIDQIDEKDRAPMDKAKVLGIKWPPILDILSIRGAKTEDIESQEVTKWLVLQAAAKVFDPLGLFAPLMVKGKILFQTLLRLGSASIPRPNS